MAHRRKKNKRARVQGRNPLPKEAFSRDTYRPWRSSGRNNSPEWGSTSFRDTRKYDSYINNWCWGADRHPSIRGNSSTPWAECYHKEIGGRIDAVSTNPGSKQKWVADYGRAPSTPVLETEYYCGQVGSRAYIGPTRINSIQGRDERYGGIPSIPISSTGCHHW